MPVAIPSTAPRCFIAIPFSAEFRQVREIVEDALVKVGFQFISLSPTTEEVVSSEIARADCIVADITSSSPNVFFEIGLAQAMGKAVFLLTQGDALPLVSADWRGRPYLTYEPSAKGLHKLSTQVGQVLRDYKNYPSRWKPNISNPVIPPYLIEWDRLNHADAENLCRELLVQMGYQQIDWVKDKWLDLSAELIKKDPDGFEYREYWLISMGRNAPPEMLLEEALMDSGYFVHRLLRRSSERLEQLLRSGTEDTPLTLLIILLKGDRRYFEELENRRLRMERRMRKDAANIRIRIWDQNHLTSLVQQFPQLGYKYFSDEARAQSKYRKTPEELYQENVDLVSRQATLITELENEKNMRVRAERDAAWKDISFSAAHKLGNPIFAIETSLDPLQKRITENRWEDATNVVQRIRISVEKAKGIVDQFKSLARAQEIKTVPTRLLPILEDACKVAEEKGVVCEINAPADITLQADPERLAECFDELAWNATKWLGNREKKTIQVKVSLPAASALPKGVDSSQKYALIHFQDNGPGIAIENKSKIFDAFFTTHDQGTGLGLALVRRVIEGHGGSIIEIGSPRKGADFEIYLPLATKKQHTVSAPTKKRKAVAKKRTTAVRKSAKKG